MRCLSHEEIVEKRRELFRLMNSDAFYIISQWPSLVVNTFWENLLSDEDSFKMMLFLIGNRLRFLPCQIDWVIAKVNAATGIWFYFDIYHQKVLHKNGDLKRHS